MEAIRKRSRREKRRSTFGQTINSLGLAFRSFTFAIVRSKRLRPPAPRLASYPGAAKSSATDRVKYFITTAIDYTNGDPHIGHAYEKILADVIARYHRTFGGPTFFLTGVDQHGQKVQQAAQKSGVQPMEFAQEVTEKFLALWDKLGIQKDGWAATTDPR